MTPCVRDPAPWLALARTLIDATRSPYRRDAARAVDRALRAEGPRPRASMERWRAAAAAVVRDLPDPPAIPGVERQTAEVLTLLHAARAALAEIAADPAVLDLLAAVILDAEDEIRGALRWDVSVHAVERYQTGYDPEATAADARAMLYRLAARAVRVGRARDCAVWVSPEAPSVQLRVRDRCVVTVTTVAGQVARRERARWVA